MALPTPTTVAGRAGLAAILDAPGGALVATDFDGTLAGIVDVPNDARPAPGAVDALADLATLVGRLAIVTGREARTVVALAGLDRVPGLVVAGNYGLEVLRGGRLEAPPPPAGLDRARARLPALLADAARGVHVEDKGQALAVHARPAVDPVAALAALHDRLAVLGAETGLELVAGRLVLELRPPGVDKGTVIRRLAAERTPTAVLVAGDDAGDLPAFAAVAELRAAGVPGLTVAVADRDTPAELAAAADVVVAGPDGMVELLRALARQIRGRPAP
ncbi:MAG TPA: trehalose-phosphatase [Mycobacteriales bacterium]|nr:trehalose-phosphatase [Mycobacteriales bacterium]